MIKQPSAIIQDNKKVRILIGGHPGIGKSTVALSAPNPLHIDVDKGIDRVPAQYRKPYIQPEDYGELLDDLQPDNPLLADFDTLVFDTGGQLIKLMAPWVIKQNAKNGQTDGSLSLKGYGAVGREFERLMNHCYYNLNKHIVVVFHAKEEKDGDNTRLRLLVEGQTKDNVWQPMDLGGFMEMQGNNRVLGLSNCERYYAKGTHGINGLKRIPELKEGVPNNFLTLLFERVQANISAEAAVVEAERAKYDKLMADGKKAIDAVKDPKTAQKASDKIKGMDTALTSGAELRAMLLKKLKEVGVEYDKEKGAFVCKQEPTQEPAAAAS